MIGLGLIIETPRGGNAGHRFICSRNDVGEAEIARAAAAASQTAVGRAYITVSRQVTQRLANGAVREGFERMILLGLDVDQLRPEQIEQVKVELAKLLPSVDSLVQSMHWPPEGQSMVIVSEDLRGWVDSDAFRHLPVSRFSISDSTAKCVSPYKALWKWLPIGGTCILASLVVLWMILWRQGAKSDDGSIQNHSVPSTNNESKVRHLSVEWQCTPEDVVHSLLRASNWGRRRQADGLTMSAGLADGEVLAILNKVAASRGSGRYSVSPSIEGAADFCRFVEGRYSGSAEEMKQFRKWLYSSWKQFEGLKLAADKSRDCLTLDPTQDAFSRMLVSISYSQTDIGLGDTFQEPATPLLDQQDLMVFGLLEDVRQKCVAAGFDQFDTESGGDTAAEHDLGKFLTNLRVHHESVRDALTKSGEKLTYSIRDKQGTKCADAVFDAYKAFEEFLEQLSKNSNH